MKKSVPRVRASGASKQPARQKDVDAYLARVPPRARAALQALRGHIRAAAPEAIETISYRMPTFRQRISLVSFAAFAEHCSFFVMSPPVMEAHARELARYDTSKGTIRFTPEEPLPAALVKRLVRARIAETEVPRPKSPREAAQRR